MKMGALGLVLLGGGGPGGLVKPTATLTAANGNSPNFSVTFTDLQAGDVVRTYDSGSLVSSHTATAGEDAADVIALNLSALSLGSHSIQFRQARGSHVSAASDAVALTVSLPPTIASMSFWHDPSQSSSVTLNVADVSAIADLTSNARNAIQGTGAQQPLYDLGAINSLNAITYTSANNDALALLLATNIVQNVAGFTFYAVVKVASLAAAQRVFTVFNNAGVVRFVPSILVTTGKLNLGTRRLDADGGINSPAASAAVAAGTAAFCLWRVDYANGTALLQVNSTQESQAVVWTGGNGNSSNTASNVAPNYGRSATNLFGGTIGEAGGYARALNVTEIEQLRAYCQTKWGTS